MTPDYSPFLGETPIAGFYLTTGWGTWGLKAVPIAGLTMAELIATDRLSPLTEPFRLSRFTEDRSVSERARSGTH